MLTLPSSVRVYLAAEPVDLRRGHDGLCALVLALGGHDLYAGHLYVFLGRRGDRVKILFWDRGGFVLYYKRLERGRFRMPTVPAAAREVELDATTRYENRPGPNAPYNGHWVHLTYRFPKPIPVRAGESVPLVVRHYRPQITVEHGDYVTL